MSALALMCAAVLLGALACGGDDEEPTATPTASSSVPEPTVAAPTGGTVTIGSVLPSSGDGGVFGPDMIAAIDLVVEIVNNAGGVNGKQVEALHRDSATTEQVAIDAANGLVNVNGAVAIIGAWSSGVTLGVARSVSVPNGVLQISPASSSPAITSLDDNDLLFRTNMSDALQGGITASMARQLGFDKVATTYINNAYGEGLTRVFSEGFEDEGGSISAQVGHESGQVSYLSELRRAAEDDPEALVVIAYPESASVVLREAIEGDYFENFVFTDALYAQAFFDRLNPESVEGSYGTITGTAGGEALDDYNALFTAKYGRDSDAPYPGYSFDATATLLLAMEHADSEDPERVRDSLREVSSAPGERVGPRDLARALELIRAGRDVNYYGPGGEVDYDEFGDVRSAVQIWRVTDGQIEPLPIFLQPGEELDLSSALEESSMMQEPATQQPATQAPATRVPPTRVPPTATQAPAVRDEPAPQASRFVVAEGSEAIFKVDEELRGVDVVVAMQGRGISGEIDLAAGTASLAIDLHSLTSDQSRRDRYVRETMFPEFRTTGVSFSGLGNIPSDFLTSGEEFATSLPALVSVNGVANELIFDIVARVDNGTDLVALGNSEFVWSQFNMRAPVSQFFTVEDEVRVEILIRATAAPSASAPAAGRACDGGDPYRIGTLLDVTGDLGVFGPPMQVAVDLAADLVNAAGGLNGACLEVVHRDSGTSEQIATDAANALVNIDGVGAIVGSLSSGVTLGVAQSATVPNDVVLISPASTSPALTVLDDDDYLFRTAVSDALQGVVLAQVAAQLGYGNVATMYINNPYGIGLTSNFSDAFAERGGTVSEEVAIEGGEVSYLSALRRAADRGAEALVAMAYPETAGVFLREAAESGLFEQYLFVDGTKDQELFDDLGAGPFNGSYGTAPGAPPANPATATFRELYTSWTSGNSASNVDSLFVAEAFDAGVLLALAIAHARSDEGTAVRDSLRAVANPPGVRVGPGDLARALQLIRDGTDIDYVGAAGDQNLDANGDVLNTIEVWRLVNGTVTSTGQFLAPGEAVDLDR